MSTTKITDASFESDVLKATGPVLVDFWAEWCGPCKQIAPALEDLATEFGEKVTVAKLNIDENPRIPGQFGVRGIPLTTTQISELNTVQFTAFTSTI